MYLATTKLTKLGDTLKPISANARCNSCPSIAPDLSVSYLSKAPFHCWMYCQSCWNSWKLMVPDWSLSKIPDKRLTAIKYWLTWIKHSSYTQNYKFWQNNFTGPEFFFISRLLQDAWFWRKMATWLKSILRAKTWVTSLYQVCIIHICW